MCDVSTSLVPEWRSWTCPKVTLHGKCSSCDCGVSGHALHCSCLPWVQQVMPAQASAHSSTHTVRKSHSSAKLRFGRCASAAFKLALSKWHALPWKLLQLSGCGCTVHILAHAGSVTWCHLYRMQAKLHLGGQSSAALKPANADRQPVCRQAAAAPGSCPCRQSQLSSHQHAKAAW